MGITGLLPLLTSVTRTTHLAQFAGLRVAIDAYVWLHRGAYGCAYELCMGIPTHKYIAYCMKMVNLLRSYRVIPVLVFDGGNLPSKKGTESNRREKRDEAKERGRELSLAGDRKGAAECFQRAVDVTPRMAFNLIELLRKEGVEFVVAPYEADAQLTYLCLTGFVDAVISEDSDLIPYGCPRMIYKLDKDGNGKEVQFCELGSVKEVDLSRFSAEMLRHMCILSGCDYLESLPGMGLKKAHSLLQRHGTMGEVFKALESSKTPVPPDYALNFGRADLTFQHQIVYDPINKKTIHLHPLPQYVDPTTLPFAGEHLDPIIAQLVAEGRLDPHSYEPFILSIPLPNHSLSNTTQNNTTRHNQNTNPTSSSGITLGPSLHNSNSSLAPSNSLQATAIIPRSNSGNSISSPSNSSSGVVVSSSRLSTQWQSRSTTPLSVLKQSLNSSLSSSSLTGTNQMSESDKAKHDNDITRDIVRYTMQRGSGKGAKNAAQTASSIISSSTSGSPSRNTITSYYSPAKPPTSAAAAGLNMGSVLSPPSKTRSSTSIITSPKSSTNSTNNISTSSTSTVLKSRFFGGSPSTSNGPTSLATPPRTTSTSLQSITPRTGSNGIPTTTSPVPSDSFSSYSAVWDDNEIVFDEELEAIICTGTRPGQSPSVVKKSTKSLDGSLTAPLPDLPKEPTIQVIRSSTTSTVSVKTHFEEDSSKLNISSPSPVRHKVPMRLSLPVTMSIDDSDSDDEVELVRVCSDTLPLESTTPPISTLSNGLLPTSPKSSSSTSSFPRSPSASSLQRKQETTNPTQVDLTHSPPAENGRKSSFYVEEVHAVREIVEISPNDTETRISTRFDFSRLVVPSGDVSQPGSPPTTTNNHTRMLTPQSYSIRSQPRMASLESPTADLAPLTPPNLKKRARKEEVTANDGAGEDILQLEKENSPPLKMRALLAAPEVDLFNLPD